MATIEEELAAPSALLDEPKEPTITLLEKIGALADILFYAGFAVPLATQPPSKTCIVVYSRASGCKESASKVLIL